MASLRLLRNGVQGLAGSVLFEKVYDRPGSPWATCQIHDTRTEMSIHEAEPIKYRWVFVSVCLTFILRLFFLTTLSLP